jgi:long-chain fatty acid transport protein
MNITPATVELARRFTLVDPNGNFFQEGGVRLSASAVGVGGTVGIMARPVDWLHLGFNYMSRMKLTFDDGEAHFEQPADFDNSVFRDQRGTTSLTMPDTFTFGVGAELGPNAYLEFDYNYTLWETYKELEVRFNDDTTGQLSKPLARNWKNTSTYRLGFEYRFDMGFALRASFVYDESPAPASTVGPDLPDNSRLVGSLGLGYLHRPLGVKVDAYYMLSYFLPRTVDAADGNPFPARYESMAHLFGVTVGYAEPRKPPPEEKPLPPDPALPPDAPPGEPPDDTP